MNILTGSKILFFMAIIFMGIGFYTALAAAYRSDADFGEEYPQDQWTTIFCWAMMILSCLCFFASVGLLIYRILLDLNLI